MESRIQRIFLVLTMGAAWVSPGAFAATDPNELELEPLVVREPERREVDVDKLDKENFEFGVLGGLMSVEDFGTNTVVGARVAYHVTEDFFVEGQYGRTTLGETSFERLSGGAQILTDDERDMTYYNVSVGYNIFPGEIFLGRAPTLIHLTNRGEPPSQILLVLGHSVLAAAGMVARANARLVVDVPGEDGRVAAKAPRAIGH